MVTKKQVENWFIEIDGYIKEQNLCDAIKDPRRVFNADETAFYFSPKEKKVLAEKGSKIVHSVSGNNDKENITTLICANAAGEMPPPMIVFKYERVPLIVAKSVPKTWGIGRSDNGWMTCATFYEYMANVFIPWLRKSGIKLPVIFFVDGHVSHLSLHLSKLCQENGIELIALYPNSTHILQPMDVSAFHPLKTIWYEVVTEFRVKENGRRIFLHEFPGLLKQTLARLSASTFVNGFAHCGLVPFGFERVKFFIEAKKKEDKKIKTREMLVNAQNVVEECMDREVLEVFRKLYSSNAEIDVELQHISLYHVWHNIVDRLMNLSSNSSSSSSSNLLSTSSLNVTSVSSLENSINVPTEASTSVLSVPVTPDNRAVVSSTPVTTSANLINIPAEASTSVLSVPGTSGNQAAVLSTPVTTPVHSVNYNMPAALPSTASDSPSVQEDSGRSFVVPSPLKGILRYPVAKPVKSTKRKREHIPYVLTSQGWRDYHDRKAEEKKKIDDEKKEKKLERARKKKLDEEEKQKKKLERQRKKEEKEETKKQAELAKKKAANNTKKKAANNTKKKAASTKKKAGNCKKTTRKSKRLCLNMSDDSSDDYSSDQWSAKSSAGGDRFISSSDDSS